jgi:hypothetical protein
VTGLAVAVRRASAQEAECVPFGVGARVGVGRMARRGGVRRGGAKR